LHADGTLHTKSHDQKMLTSKAQRPDSIRGCPHLGAFLGHGPKTVGAVCDPADFTAVFEIPPGILGPRNGAVLIDLLEQPTTPPHDHPGKELDRRLFSDATANILIRVFA
jgi:hypothetical protein